MQYINSNKCPRCGMDMTKGKFKWICEYCDYKQDFRNNDMVNLPEDISDLFFEPAIKSYYPLLAHEYNVLKKFVDNNNYFAALLEYKDVVEILLKFPVLLAINILWHKDENMYTAADKQNMSFLLEKFPSLSLGDWQRLCGNFRNKNDSLGMLLEEIYTFYQEHKIVNWRNKTIGHGALQSDLDSDKEFQKDFKQKLKALKKHFEDNFDNYLMIKVCCADGSKLHGTEDEGFLDENIQVYIGEELIGNPSPFILVKVIERANEIKRLTDLFDSYSYKKNEVYVLNYVKYGKTKHIGNIADEFALRSRKILTDEQLAQASLKLTNELLYQDDIETFLNMADDKIFEPPNYILKNIKKYMSDHPEGGVMFLQMDRGMGKTTLVRAIDQLAMYKERIDELNDTIVRAFYINNKFAYKIEDFSNDVLFSLSMDHRGSKKQFRLGISPSFADKNKEEMAEYFSQFLIKVREKYLKPPFEFKKLLFIIDGLDEIRLNENSESGTIFDCIPCSKQMGKSVYILVTGRSENEVSESIQDQYTSIKRKNIELFCYKRKDDGNKILLQNYLSKQLNNDKKYINISKDKKYIIDALCEKGEYRFLYVKALRELARMEGFNVDSITNDNIMQCYLDILKRKYGNGKYYEKLTRVFVITSILEEPATIEEIAYLYCSSEAVNLRFLGYLTDLRGLLIIDRTEINESISVHERWKQSVITKEGNCNIIKETINEWVDEFKNRATIGNIQRDTFAYECYLAANLYTMAKRYHPEIICKLYYDDIINYISRIVKEIAFGVAINAKRTKRIIGCAVDIIEDAKKKNINIMTESAAYLYMRLAQKTEQHVYHDDYIENPVAIAYYDKSINILQNLQSMGQLSNTYGLIESSIGKGRLLCNYGDIEKADYYFEIVRKAQNEQLKVIENEIANHKIDIKKTEKDFNNSLPILRLNNDDMITERQLEYEQDIKSKYSDLEKLHRQIDECYRIFDRERKNIEWYKSKEYKLSLISVYEGMIYEEIMFVTTGPNRMLS